MLTNISQSNPKEFYSYIKKQKNLHIHHCSINLHTSNKTIILNILNNFYASNFTVEDTTVFHPIPQHNIRITMFFLTRIYSMIKTFHSLSLIWKLIKLQIRTKISLRLLKRNRKRNISSAFYDIKSTINSLFCASIGYLTSLPSINKVLSLILVIIDQLN